MGPGWIRRGLPRSGTCAQGIGPRQRGLDSDVIDGGDAVVVKPGLEAGGRVIDPEVKRWSTLGIGSGRPHERSVLILQKIEIAAL